MGQIITELFRDNDLAAKIQKKLPELFQIAEIENSRAHKIGMQVGSVRENILVALLVFKFGENNVKTDIPITKAEVDVELFGNPVSIKTITGKNPVGVKLNWTVDPTKSALFVENYVPSCDMIFVHINWENSGGLYLFSKEAQIETINKLGKSEYVKLPKVGTNPRGVEISSLALNELFNHPETLVIPINWKKEMIDFKPYQRWIELWQQD